MAAVKHKIGNNFYLYEHYRDGDKVRTKYIGPVDAKGNPRSRNYGGVDSSSYRILRDGLTIKDKPVEYGMVHDPETGEMIGEVSEGVGDMVEYNIPEGESLVGKVTTHNHPLHVKGNIRGLSIGDVRNAIATELKKSIVVTPTHRYTLELHKEDGRQWVDEVDDVFMDEKFKIVDELVEKHNMDEVDAINLLRKDKTEIDGLRYNDQWINTFNKLDNFTYTVEEL